MSKKKNKVSHINWYVKDTYEQQVCTEKFIEAEEIVARSEENKGTGKDANNLLAAAYQNTILSSVISGFAQLAIVKGGNPNEEASEMVDSVICNEIIGYSSGLKDKVNKKAERHGSNERNSIKSGLDVFGIKVGQISETNIIGKNSNIHDKYRETRKSKKENMNDGALKSYSYPKESEGVIDVCAIKDGDTKSVQAKTSKVYSTTKAYEMSKCRERGTREKKLSSIELKEQQILSARNVELPVVDANFIDCGCNLEALINLIGKPLKISQQITDGFYGIKFQRNLFKGVIAYHNYKSGKTPFYPKLLLDESVIGTVIILHLTASSSAGVDEKVAEFHAILESSEVCVLGVQIDICLPDIELRISDSPFFFENCRRFVSIAIQCLKPIVVTMPTDLRKEGSRSINFVEDNFSLLNLLIPDLQWPILIRATSYAFNASLLLNLLRERPNCFVSFDGRITHAKQKILKEFVFDVPVDRFIIESNSPYFAPASVTAAAGGSDASSHVGHVLLVASQIAEVKRIDIDAVLVYSNSNAQRLYRLM